jgi:hypothetical protein
MTHDCNYYCRDGLHAEVYHTDKDATEGMIWQALGYYRGLKVERAERILEAPEPGTDVIVAGSKPATTPWLVWWR